MGAKREAENPGLARNSLDKETVLSCLRFGGERAARGCKGLTRRSREGRQVAGDGRTHSGE